MSAPSRHDDRPEPLKPTAPLHWGLGFLSGLLHVAAGSPETRRHQALQRWTRHWLRLVGRLQHPHAPPPAVHSPTDSPTLIGLRDSLTGRTRGQVVTMLGPPAASSFPGDSSPPAIRPNHYWHADVWYYRFDTHHHLAIALTFAKGIVTRVDEIPGPD